jgi:uncharacterized membrane protein
VVTLQRTADNKFMRLFGDDPEDPDELEGGFPKTREELFRYRALVLGSVEAGIFSGDQLQMISEFVEKRGGGLLMLGGARSFGEGGYGGTPVADALPLEIDPKTRASEPGALSRLKVTPTRAGQAHAVAQIGDSEEASMKRWSELPLVTATNAPLPPKPGATVLLTGTDERGRTMPVLVSQRYGRGKSVAQTLQETWQWQMHASIPLEDMTHEHYWRQLLRWLVDGVPDAVDVKTTRDRVEPGEAVTIEASVVDKRFVELNDATVVATVAQPNGKTMTVPMQWTGEHDGQYRGTFVSTDAGAYEVNVDATRAGGQAVGAGVTYVRAAPSEAEFFDPTMHSAPLRRIAEETSGRFYTPATAQGLAEDIRYAGRGVTSIEERELWNMPIILVALMCLVCAEWGYRTRGGSRLMLKAFLLIVVGLAGDPESAKDSAPTFHKWGNTLAEASEKLGVPTDRLVYLVDSPLEGDVRVSGKATRDEITKALDGFGKKAGAEDVVFIVLIGQGSDDNRVAKFNLPGPDISAPEFDTLLKKLPTKQIVLVDTTSASGPFIEALSAPGRTIVTATRSGAEHFNTLFGGYFVEALTSAAADADKNKRVSVLEAFQYAKTRSRVRTSARVCWRPSTRCSTTMATRKAAPIRRRPARTAASLRCCHSGPRARTICQPIRSCARSRLERRDLERRVEALRLLKDSMDPAKYSSELEKLVTAIGTQDPGDSRRRSCDAQESQGR